MTIVVLVTGTAKQGERGFDSLPFSEKKRLISRAWVTKSRSLGQAFHVETVETGTKAPFTRPKIFGTARMKKVRVPKKLVRHG